jgi:hypothetical protein
MFVYFIFTIFKKRKIIEKIKFKNLKLLNFKNKTTT